MYGSNNAVERRASNTSTRPLKPNGTQGTGPGQDSTVSAMRQVDTHRELRMRAAKGLAEAQGAASSDMAGTGRGHCHPVMAGKEWVLVGRGSALSAALWGPHFSEKPPKPE